MIFASPRTNGAGNDDIAGAGCRTAGRLAERRLLHNRRDEAVQKLERFVVEDFLLRLAGYFSLCLTCTE